MGDAIAAQVQASSKAHAEAQNVVGGVMTITSYLGGCFPDHHREQDCFHDSSSRHLGAKEHAGAICHARKIAGANSAAVPLLHRFRSLINHRPFVSEHEIAGPIAMRHTELLIFPTSLLNAVATASARLLALQVLRQRNVTQGVFFGPGEAGR